MTTAPRKSGRGCFFYGCLTSIILVILVVVGGYLGVRWWFNKQVIALTDDRPMALPEVQFTREEADAVRERVDTFSKAVEADEPAEPLVLTGQELNMLIATVPDLELIRDRVHFDIQEDRVKGAISIPVETIPFKWLQKHKGRYLNGAAELNASLSNGVFQVTLQSLEVKGKPLPEQVMTGLRQQNLARDFYKSEEGIQLLQKLDSITVSDDRITIAPRNGG
jgi:hypothetical protein